VDGLAPRYKYSSKRSLEIAEMPASRRSLLEPPTTKLERPRRRRLSVRRESIADYTGAAVIEGEVRT
jgi:hypothetical protein